MHPENPDCLLAGAGLVNYGSRGSGSGMFLTIDGGVTWKRGTLEGSGEVIEDMITSVEFSTRDPQIAYAAGPRTFYRSVNGGVNWRGMSGGPPQNFYGPLGIKTGFPVDLQVDPWSFYIFASTCFIPQRESRATAVPTNRSVYT
jgi:hypothetical protein